MELKLFIPEKTTWGQIKGTREVHQENTWDQIKRVQVLQSPYIFPASLTLDCCYKTWQSNNAILFYFTQNSFSKIWFSTSAQRSSLYIIIRHLYSISCYTSILKSEILLKQSQENLYDVIINLEKMLILFALFFFSGPSFFHRSF